MGKLNGKVAVITGGNSGIGLATAKLFHAEGAKVVIAGRDQKTLDSAKKEIGGDTLAVKSDVAKLGDIDNLYKTVKEKFGTRAGLIDAILGLEKRTKDEGYKSRLTAYPVPRLWDLYQSVDKRTKRAEAAKAPKKATWIGPA